MPDISDAELAIIAKPFAALSEALKEDDSPEAANLKIRIAEVDKILSKAKASKDKMMMGGSVINDYLCGQKSKGLFEMFHLDGRVR